MDNCDWVFELARRPGAVSKGRPGMFAVACWPVGMANARQAVEIDRETYDLLMERVSPDGGRDWRNDLVTANGRRHQFLSSDKWEGQRQWEWVRVDNG